MSELDRKIDCGSHGKRRGYIVCGHVLRGASVAYVEAPGLTHACGQIVCSRPHDTEEAREGARLVCELCCLAKGWLAIATCTGITERGKA